MLVKQIGFNINLDVMGLVMWCVVPLYISHVS